MAHVCNREQYQQGSGLGWPLLPLAPAWNLTCDPLPYATAPGRLCTRRDFEGHCFQFCGFAQRGSALAPSVSVYSSKRYAGDQEVGASGGQNLRHGAEPANMPRLFSQQVWGGPSSATTWPHQRFSVADRAQSLRVRCVCVHSLQWGEKEGWRLCGI